MLWVQSIVISMSVCLSVCPLAYLKNHMTKFHQILCTCYVTCDRDSIFSDCSGIRYYVLPVLWMTSCLHIMVRIGHRIIYRPTRWRTSTVFTCSRYRYNYSLLSTCNASTANS